MRMRLVDAWDLEAKLRASAAELDTTIYTAPADEINELYREFLIIIRHSPIIDAEPVRHGKWENGKCSICNKMSVTSVKFKGEIVFEDTFEFCPHCGAKMDQE